MPRTVLLNLEHLMVSYFILIQGPYSKHTSKLVHQLHSIFGNTRIVVSCYDEPIDQTVENIAEIRRSTDPGTILVPPRGKPFNLVRQATTIHAGCEGAEEDWVLKFRSDLQVVDAAKFLKAIKIFQDGLKQGKPIKLVSLNTGCFDIFCHYEMPLHFNDLFFICPTSTLRKNVVAVRQIDEISLIGFNSVSSPKNYRHSKRYNLRFHVEQMIHFGSAMSKHNWLDHCCDMSGSGKFRHMIWVGRHLMVYTMKNIGLKSAKVGYPSLGSHLVSVSSSVIYLHKQLIASKGYRRILLIYILKTYGLLRYSCYCSLKGVNLVKRAIRKANTIVRQQL